MIHQLYQRHHSSVSNNKPSPYVAQSYRRYIDWSKYNSGRVGRLALNSEKDLQKMAKDEQSFLCRKVYDANFTQIIKQHVWLPKHRAMVRAMNWTIDPEEERRLEMELQPTFSLPPLNNKLPPITSIPASTIQKRSTVTTSTNTINTNPTSDIATIATQSNDKKNRKERQETQKNGKQQ